MHKPTQLLIAAVAIGTLATTALTSYTLGASNASSAETVEECAIALLFIDPDLRDELSDEEVALACDVNVNDLIAIREDFIEYSTN